MWNLSIKYEKENYFTVKYISKTKEIVEKVRKHSLLLVKTKLGKIIFNWMIKKVKKLAIFNPLNVFIISDVLVRFFFEVLTFVWG